MWWGLWAPLSATVEIQIRDLEGNVLEPDQTGEICGGRNVMKGYLNRPEDTRAVFWGDWFRTGDMGRMDGSDICISWTG